MDQKEVACEAVDGIYLPTRGSSGGILWTRFEFHKGRLFLDHL